MTDVCRAEAALERSGLACTISERADDLGRPRRTCSIRDIDSGRELLRSCDCPLPCTKEGCSRALDAYGLIAPQVELACRRGRGEGACTMQAMERYVPRHEFARWRCNACGAVSFAPKRTLPPAFCRGCGRRVALIEGAERSQDGS